jgi:hypothetical protein
VAIVGERPETGVRLTLDRSFAGGASGLVYEGQIATKEGEFAVRVDVDGAEVRVATEAGADLAEKARLIVRTVLRHAEADAVPPPRRIQRWRAD